MMKNGYANNDSSMHGRVISVDHLPHSRQCARRSNDRSRRPARAAATAKQRVLNPDEIRLNPGADERMASSGDAAVRSAARARSAGFAWLAYRQRQRGAARRA
jgi:hypothetical protein